MQHEEGGRAAAALCLLRAAAAIIAATVLPPQKKAARLNKESGRYGSTQCRVIKGSRGTRHWCQISSPAIV